MNKSLQEIIQSFESDSRGENFWRSAADALGEGMFIVDPDRNVIFWNRAAEVITGYSREKAIGKSCISATRCRDCLYECGLFEKGDRDDIEQTFTRADGTPLPVRKNARLLKNERGEIICGIETFRDIRAEKERETEIERQRNILEIIINSMVEGAIACDKEMRIVSFSHRAQQITGHSEVEALGKKCGELLGAGICEEMNRIGKMLSGEAKGESVLLEVKTKSENLLPVEINAMPLKDIDGEVKGGLLLLRDVSPEMKLKELVKGGHSYSKIVGRSERMKRVFEIIESAAPTDASVLIIGESGTGKELVARALHDRSRRAENPFVAINCAALPSELLESELFGYERGAFTGAAQTKRGRFELADKGTLMLDEIGELPLQMQAKLLRTLEEKTIVRLGGTQTIPIDVRLISATNRNLERMVEEGTFRGDLYYRLKVVPIALPPLRERREDIELIALKFLDDYAKKSGIKLKVISPAARKLLREWPWRGNVRELFNALEYAVTMGKGDVIEIGDLPPEFHANNFGAAKETTTTDEKETLLRALSQAGGNKSRAAIILGMDRTTLWRKLKKHGIKT